MNKKQIPDYLSINKNTWNNKTAYHVNSGFYNMQAFLSGNTSLNSIELELLGDVSQKSILHLQCHFGQDSISLARMGASVTGVDLSDVAIAKATELAVTCKAGASFICCDIYSLPNHLNQQFDMVFTSYGTIGWLPDIDKWANIVSQFLKPGGTFVFAEFHPVVWMFNNDFNEIAYRYFKSEPIIEMESGTYADRDANIATKSITWNHGLGEVVSSLLKHGLSLQCLQEFDYSPYDCFNHTVEVAPQKYRIRNLSDKIPMVYALKAIKTSSGT